MKPEQVVHDWNVRKKYINFNRDQQLSHTWRLRKRGTNQGDESQQEHDHHKMMRFRIMHDTQDERKRKLSLPERTNFPSLLHLAGLGWGRSPSVIWPKNKT